MRRTIVLLGALLAIGCSPAPAQKKFVVLDIAGARSADLRDSVVASVDENYELVPTRTYQRTARKLRAKRVTSRNVRRVSKRLGVSYVLEGKLVRKRRNRAALHLRVRDGASGTIIGRYVLPVRNRDLTRKSQRKLGVKLARTFDRADAAAETRARRSDDKRARTARAERRRDEARKRRREANRRRVEERAQDQREARRAKQERAQQRREARDRKRDKAERRAAAKAQRKQSRRERIAAKKAERQDAARDRKRRAREERLARRAAPTKRMKQRRVEPEPKDDIDDEPVKNDPLDEDGQAIDDEVPAALR